MRYNLRSSRLMYKYSVELLDTRFSLVAFYTILNSNLEENYRIVRSLGLKQYKNSILNKLFGLKGFSFSNKVYVRYLSKVNDVNLDFLKLKHVDLDGSDLPIYLTSLLLDRKFILKNLNEIFLLLELNRNYLLLFQYFIMTRFFILRFSFFSLEWVSLFFLKFFHKKN